MPTGFPAQLHPEDRSARLALPWPPALGRQRLEPRRGQDPRLREIETAAFWVPPAQQGQPQPQPALLPCALCRPPEEERAADRDLFRVLTAGRRGPSPEEGALLSWGRPQAPLWLGSDTRPTGGPRPVPGCAATAIVCCSSCPGRPSFLRSGLGGRWPGAECLLFDLYPLGPSTRCLGCWEETLSSFPRSPTHFNELAGSPAPTARLPAQPPSAA